MENSYKVSVRRLKGTNHLGDVGVDGRIILKRVLKK
jgi:hypothetical protein